MTTTGLPMTRERLEAAIWRAMKTWRVTTLHPVPFVDTILAAAAAHALTEGGLTAQRRAAIADAVRGEGTATHLGSVVRACGGKAARGEPALTTDPAKVTCRRCMQTGRWRKAVQEAS